ncbi:unnamed protein product, partial [Hapterophycus canaliculatus]
GGGGLSLVRSAVDLVISNVDKDDRSSSWVLRLLGIVQQTVVARGQRRGSVLVPSDGGGGGGGGNTGSGALDAGSIEAERHCLERLAASVFKHEQLLDGVQCSRLVRAAHVSAARAIFDAFQDDRLRERFPALVFRRTTDVDAGVRSAAVGATRTLFRRFLPEKHNAIFATVLARLPPVVVVNDRVEVELDDDGDADADDEEDEEGGGGGGGTTTMLASERAYAKLSDGRSDRERTYFVVCRREFEATSLVTVADMAVSSPRVTRAALYHLLRRSVRPELASAVRRLTERLAAGLGFASGPALLREHLMFLMSRWLSDRSSLDGFPFELLGHAGHAGGGGERGRVDALRACAHVAVPLAVVQLGRQDRLREVQAMAGELGMGPTDDGVARLVRLHVADIKAVYLPLLYTGGGGGGGGGGDGGSGGASANPGGGSVDQDKRVANEADGFLQRVIDARKIGKASDNLQTLVLRLLDMGAMEPFGAFGRVTLKSIADTLEQVAGQLEGAGSGAPRASVPPSTAAGVATLTGAGDLLRRVNFVEVLLHLRGHIARARGDEAQRRVFGMLEFVVTKARAEEDASCLSSTVSVLLWLLEVRASELAAATAAAAPADTRVAEKAESSGGARGTSGGGGGGGEAPDGGAAAVVKLMEGVFVRCMSTSRGRMLLGRHFGAVVEQLVAVFVDLDAVQSRELSRSTAGRADRPSPTFPPHDDDDDDDNDDDDGDENSASSEFDDEDDDDDDAFELTPRQDARSKKAKKKKKEKGRAPGLRQDWRGGGGARDGR